MFDAAYFQEHFVNQIREIGAGSTTAWVHLYGGQRFAVRQVSSVHEGYVFLEVFPPEGVNDKSKAARHKPGGTSDVSWDRIAVSYAAVSHVFLTIAEPEVAIEMGFHAVSV